MKTKVLQFIKENPGSTANDCRKTFGIKKHAYHKIIGSLRRGGKVLCKYDSATVYYFASRTEFKKYFTKSEKFAIQITRWMSMPDMYQIGGGKTKTNNLARAGENQGLFDIQGSGKEKKYKYNGNRIKELPAPIDHTPEKKQGKKEVMAMMVISEIMLHGNNQGFIDKLATAVDKFDLKYWLSQGRSIRSYVKSIDRVDPERPQTILSKIIKHCNNNRFQLSHLMTYKPYDYWGKKTINEHIAEIKDYHIAHRGIETTINPQFVESFAALGAS